MKYQGTALIICLILTMFSEAGGAAQSQVEIDLRTPPRHQALYETANWYDASNETIDVQGYIRGLGAAPFQNGQLGVLMNGRTWLNVQAQGAGLAFSGRMPLPVPEGRWVLATVLVEVVNRFNNQVLARATSTFYDLRVDGTAPLSLGIQPFFTGDRIEASISAQLTDAGIGNPGPQDVLQSLEVAHQSSLPYPSMADFNAAVAQAFRTAPPYDALADSGEVCFDIEFAEDTRFASQTDFLPLAEAMAVAQALHLAYANVEEYIQDGAATLSVSIPGVGTAVGSAIVVATELLSKNICASSAPQVNDFKVCFRQLDGQAEDLSVGAVADVDLSFGPTDPATGGSLNSEVRLGNLRGEVSAYLRDLSVKWRDSSCLGVFPGINKSDDYITRTDWLNEWSSCDDLSLTATALSSSQPTAFSLARAARNREHLDVKRSAAGQLTLEGVTHDRGNRGCAEEWLDDEITGLLQSYEDDVVAVVSEEWERGSPNSMHQAQALEDLLAPLEIGTVPHADYDLKAVPNPPETLTKSGLSLDWSTQVEIFDPALKSKQSASWFYFPDPDHLPWHEDGAIDGVPFDLSYSITTGFLNQLIHAHSGLLSIDYRPSWDDLYAFDPNVTPQAVGQSADSPPEFDAVLLDAMFPQALGMFAELGGRKLEIHLSPKLTPLVWMPPDLSLNEMTPHGFPLRYGMADLEIRFVEPAMLDQATGAEIAPEAPWLVLNVGFLDDDFSFSVEWDSLDPFLAAEYGNDQWTVGVQHNAFSTCPMFTHEDLQPPVASCERDLEAAVAGLFQPTLRGILRSMLAEIPFPRAFDAEGNSRVRLLVGSIRRWQVNQHVTFYFDIPDGER